MVEFYLIFALKLSRLLGPPYYKDQYVLNKGDKFNGAYTTDAEAYKSGLEEFGNQPFLIKQVLEDDANVSYPALTVGAINITP
jgi:hypothetical protein